MSNEQSIADAETPREHSQGSSASRSGFAEETSIDISGLELTYGDGTEAVSGVDLTVGDGEFWISRPQWRGQDDGDQSARDAAVTDCRRGPS